MLLLLGLSTAAVYAGNSGAEEPASFEQFWADAQKPNRADKSLASQRRLDWWRNAKLGLFIHWDPSSVAASEISWSKQFYEDDGEHLRDNPRPSPELFNIHEHRFWLDWFKPPVPREVYDNLYKSFYPGMFDADRFVGIAKRAGIKYIIQVSKHHNGFCMWDTRFTDYNVMNTPFHRDIGVYYSQRDWHHPDYGPERMAKYNEYMHSQIRELLTRYRNIRIIFFDSEQYYPWQMWESDKMFRMIYELRPDIIINDRSGVPADYFTPEQSIGTFNLERDWESCMTFTGFWGWHGFQAKVIPYEEFLQRLVRAAGGNGNLLMNVGPMPTGQIDPREADRLLRVGAWLEKNGESIYGTRGGPYMPSKFVVSTRKAGTIYLHVLRWNGESVILPPLPKKVLKSSLLSGGRGRVDQTADGLRITVAEKDRQAGDTVLKVQVSGSAMDIAPIPTP
ncbi:MAG: alpha-L-fucosidase [Acidobacteria bacterium]|nr:alpha-L-fucosidase [Acidobacteriota bacterium]